MDADGGRPGSGQETDEMGPVDFVLVELAPGQTTFSAEMAHELVVLSRAGLIRVLDLLVLQRDERGAIEAFEVDDLAEVDELALLEDEVAEILAAKDVAHLAAAMENGTTAGVIVWENRWAAGFASAVRRSGGQIVASGRIPTQAIVASLESDPADEDRGG